MLVGGDSSTSARILSFSSCIPNVLRLSLSSATNTGVSVPARRSPMVDLLYGIWRAVCAAKDRKWPEIVQVPNRKRLKEQKSSLFVYFVVSLYLYIHGLSLSSFHYIHSYRVCINETHQYVRLNWSQNLNWQLLIIRGVWLASSAAKADIANSADRHTYSLTAEYIRARYLYLSDTNDMGSSPCISIFFAYIVCS